MLRMWMANNNRCRTFICGIGYINGALNGACRTAQEEFAVFGWKLSWLLDCPGFCHVLVHRLAGSLHDTALWH